MYLEHQRRLGWALPDAHQKWLNICPILWCNCLLSCMLHECNAKHSDLFGLLFFDLLSFQHIYIYIYIQQRSLTSSPSSGLTWVRCWGYFFVFVFHSFFFLSLNYDLFNFLRSDCNDGSPDFVSLYFLQFWSGFFPFSLQHSNKNKIIVNSDSLTNYLSLCVYVCVCVYASMCVCVVCMCAHSTICIWCVTSRKCCMDKLSFNIISFDKMLGLTLGLACMPVHITHKDHFMYLRPFDTNLVKSWPSAW